MTRFLRYRTAPLMVLLLVLAACGGGSGGSPEGEGGDAGDRTIAVVTPYMANDTTRLVIELFEEQATERDWTVGVTDTAGDFDRLVGAIQDAVSSEVDAIVLGMGEPEQMTAGLNAAEAAGIPVFAIDAAAAPGVLVNVTSDNEALGRMSAEDLIEHIGGEGPVVLFTHDPHPGVRARAAAAAETFEAAGIEILDKRHIEVPGPVDNARTLSQDLLVSHSEPGSIAGIWAGWDEPALGATQAIEAADRGEIAVVGIDGTDFALEEIGKGGPFKSTVAQDWEGIAALTAELIENYFDGEEPEQDQYTLPGKLLTADDAE